MSAVASRFGRDHDDDRRFTKMASVFSVDAVYVKYEPQEFIGGLVRR